PADSTLLFGVNLGGHAARATLHGDGGRIRQENFRATAYASALPTPLTFIDAAIYGGFSDYTVNRHQASPLQPAARATANADTTGFDAGASLRAGLFLPLGLFMFTPHVGLEYTHAEVDAFTENAKHRTGADLAEDFTADALHLSRLNQDSLRAQIGGALSCQASLISHVGVRLSLNFSYARELLDTKTKIHARFADNANNAGGGAPAFFDTRVVSTAQDIVQVGPSLEFAFSPNTTLTIGYTYGSDLRDQTANRIHAAFHLRF
ncbi:MAG: autotransporter outer membrane beta-barrel domain-containing protein, partial [Puniceicoccales bacterium]|nr:autotransporter outer membrane beta-barrel domain-containing protein [Puniceicoccales bacterium]